MTCFPPSKSDLQGKPATTKVTTPPRSEPLPPSIGRTRTPAPSNIVFTHVGPDTIRAQWTPPPDIDNVLYQYVLKRMNLQIS